MHQKFWSSRTHGIYGREKKRLNDCTSLWAVFSHSSIIFCLEIIAVCSCFSAPNELPERVKATRRSSCVTSCTFLRQNVSQSGKADAIGCGICASKIKSERSCCHKHQVCCFVIGLLVIELFLVYVL